MDPMGMMFYVVLNPPSLANRRKRHPNLTLCPTFHPRNAQEGILSDLSRVPYRGPYLLADLTIYPLHGTFSLRPGATFPTGCRSPTYGYCSNSK